MRSSRSLRDEAAAPPEAAGPAGEDPRGVVLPNPSRPPASVVASFCVVAGASPSKSMSNRFSTLFWGAPEAAAAAAAAAAMGFSRAFWSCSLLGRQSTSLTS